MPISCGGHGIVPVPVPAVMPNPSTDVARALGDRIDLTVTQVQVPMQSPTAWPSAACTATENRNSRCDVISGWLPDEVSRKP